MFWAGELVMIRAREPSNVNCKYNSLIKYIIAADRVRQKSMGARPPQDGKGAKGAKGINQGILYYIPIPKS
jgi:hypothetical protein